MRLNFHRPPATVPVCETDLAPHVSRDRPPNDVARRQAISYEIGLEVDQCRHLTDNDLREALRTWAGTMGMRASDPRTELRDIAGFAQALIERIDRDATR